MEEAGPGDFPENPARVLGKALDQLRARLAIEAALRVEKVRAIQDAPHHVPLRQA